MNLVRLAGLPPVAVRPDRHTSPPRHRSTGTTLQGIIMKNMAYDAVNCEHVKLGNKEIDERLAKGPELVSAKFVIPYPPGFPIMVPGQVVTKEIIAFMRKLDVKEIHGYEAAKGLELLAPDALAAHGKKNSSR